MPNSPSPERLPQGISAEKYARLKAEAKAPYKGLRKVIYGTAGASGAIGAFIMLTQVLAGGDFRSVLPNLLIQFAVVGVVVLLFRLESRK